MNGWIEGSEQIPTDTESSKFKPLQLLSGLLRNGGQGGPRIHHKGLRTLKILSPYFIDPQP